MFLRLHRACFAPSKTVHLFIFLLPPLPFPTSSFPPPLSSSPAPPFFSERPTGDGERKRWSERESARARVRKNGVRQKKKQRARRQQRSPVIVIGFWCVVRFPFPEKKIFFFRETRIFFLRFSFPEKCTGNANKRTSSKVLCSDFV